MGELIAPLEIVGGLLLLFGLIIGGFILRRRLLGRNAATFDCSLRRDRPRKPGGWMLGVARYEEDRLEWFRIFTFDPRPGQVLQRARLELIEGRQPTDEEIDSILPESVVARCSYDQEIFELAMTQSDYTGFTTWLESAPPGIAPFTS
ncbi:MAG TPA: DUF2550 domain-containing protein [Kineosporiaceae bacterium]|nr:DUF2550 domain-containing protein [Kineosporiaceae bacterium]